jgi:hypothetical protein
VHRRMDGFTVRMGRNLGQAWAVYGRKRAGGRGGSQRSIRLGLAWEAILEKAGFRFGLAAARGANRIRIISIICFTAAAFCAQGQTGRDGWARLASGTLERNHYIIE